MVTSLSGIQGCQKIIQLQDWNNTSWIIIRLLSWNIGMKIIELGPKLTQPNVQMTFPSLVHFGDVLFQGTVLPAVPPP